MFADEKRDQQGSSGWISVDNEAVEDIKSVSGPCILFEGFYILGEYMSEGGSVVLNKLYALALNHIISKVLSIAAELKLDEHITEAPLHVNQVAKQLGLHPQAAWRFLRILDAYDVVELADDNMVKASPLTPYLSHLCSPHIFNSYDCFREILFSLKNNTACYSKAFGSEFYPHIISSPEQTKMFADWCAESVHAWMQSVFALYDFSQFEHIVDVGGGQGDLLAAILHRHPNSKGTLFDQTEILTKAPSVFEQSSVLDRVEIVAGDFFDAVPSYGDAYIICRTLLNWNNEDAARILRTCYTAMPPNAKLIIIDFYVPKKTHEHYQRAILSDFNLFALLNSGNRTMGEWKQLLEKSRFEMTHVFLSAETTHPEPILPICIIEATKEIT